MKYIYRVYAIFLCIINSIFLTNQIGRNTLTTSLNYIFVFIYFIFINFVIYVFYLKYIKINIKYKKKCNIILISIILGILIFLSISNKFTEKYNKTSITIQPLSNEMEFSEDDSIWISNIIVDGNNISLADFSLTTGWNYISEWDDIISTTAKPEPLALNFPKAEKIQIRFAYYNKFAETCLIKDGNNGNFEKIKLVNFDSEGFLYEVKSNFEINDNWFNIFTGIIFVSSIMYVIICLLLLKEKNFNILYLVLLISMFFISNDIKTTIGEKIFLILISIIVGLNFNNILVKERILKYTNKVSKIIIIGISMYSTFACVGYKLFLEGEKISFTISKVSQFLICTLWFIPLIIFLLYLLEVISMKLTDLQNKKNRKLMITSKSSDIKVVLLIFLSIFLIWEIVLLGYFPANMSYDSIDQWAQALGLREINNHHPAFHTIIIRILINIINSPFWVASIQVISMAAICTCYIMLLYKGGINLKILFLFSIIFAILPNNLMLVTTIWKDIPFTISLLWLTYLIGKISISPKKFFDKWYLILILTICIVCVRFFRHNGIIPYVLMVLFLLFLSIKYFSEIKFKAIGTLLLTIFLTMLIQGPIYNYYQVQQTQNNTSYATMFCALGSAINKDATFSKETNELLESIMPLQEWKVYYNRFSSDYYLFVRKGGMDLSNISAKQAFLAYFEGLFKYPDIIIKDRLDGMNLLWDVTQPKESFNYIYSEGVSIPKGIEPSIVDVKLTDDKNLQYIPENIVTKFIHNISRITSKIPLSDIFLNRSGIYIIFYLVLLFFSHKNKQYQIWWISIPFIGNTISLILSMAHQSYRYIYYVPLCVITMTIIILCNNSKDIIEDKN